MRNSGILPIVSIIFSISACTNDGSIVLSLNIDAPECRNKSFCDYFSKVEIIPLEDSVILSNYQFSEPQYFAVTDESFFVLDERTNSVFRFDSAGRFIEETSRRGRGPGEYSLAYAIRTDEGSNTLRVLDPRGSVYYYDITASSRFVSSEEIDGVLAVQNFVQAGEEVILFSSSEDRHLRVWDGKKLTDIPYRSEIPLKGQYNAADPVICDNGNYFYYEGYSGNIYSLSDDLKTISLSYIWDFGRHTLNSDKIKDPNYDFMNILKGDMFDIVFPFANLQIIDNVIWATVIYHNQEHSLIYDLDTGDHSFFRLFSEGVRFKFQARHKDNLYLMVEPESLHEFVNESVLDERGKVVLREIPKGQVNPVILKYSLLSNC